MDNNHSNLITLVSEETGLTDLRTLAAEGGSVAVFSELESLVAIALPLESNDGDWTLATVAIRDFDETVVDFLERTE